MTLDEPDDHQHIRELTSTLETAIRAKLTAYGFTGVLNDWIVIAAQSNIDDNGNPATDIAAFMPTGGLPMHRALGLLDYMAARYRGDIAAGRH